MPGHVAAVFLTIALVPLAAVLASVYALSARSRARLRLPAVLTAIAAFSVMAWAAVEGEALLRLVESGGSAMEVEAATAHAFDSANLAYAVGTMLLLVLATAWWVLRPGRPVTLASRVASGLLVASAATAIVTLWAVAEAGARAAWMA